MSRGHGKVEREILRQVEERRAFYLLELFPGGLNHHFRGSSARVVSVRRAARKLAQQGKVRLYYSRDREHRLVVAQPSVDLDTLRRCLPRMTARRRIELDLRKIDDDLAAGRIGYNDESYQQWLDEEEAFEEWTTESGDDDEAFEEWLAYGSPPSKRVVKVEVVRSARKRSGQS